MNCSTDGQYRELLTGGDATFWIRVCLLGGFGILEAAANLILIARIGSRLKTSSSFDRLLRAKCVWGVLLLVSTIPLHIVILIYGGRKLNELTCCFCGTAFQVILGTFNTIEMLICLERFMKILKPSEHLALFSKVNVRLMLWSAVLMHCMASLGPAYGWGHYTHSSERLRLWLVPHQKIGQRNSSHGIHRSLALHNYDRINDEVTPDKLPAIFNTSQVASAEFYAFPNGMQLDVIGGADVSLGCIVEEHQSGALSQTLLAFFVEHSAAFRELIGANASQLFVDLDHSKASENVEEDRGYYDSTICEVNYHVTGTCDTFYLLMTSLMQLLLPLLFIVYCNSRVIHRLWISRESLKVSLLSKDYDQTIETLLGSSIFVACAVPYFAANLAVRCGRQVSPSVHFGARLVLYLSAGGAVVAHSLIHRQHIVDYWHTKVSYLSWERDIGLAGGGKSFLAQERSTERSNGDVTNRLQVDTTKRLHSTDMETSVI